MAKEKLRDKNGRTIGYFESSLNGETIVYDEKSSKKGEIKPQGSKFIAYDKYKQQIAYWDQSRNITFDKRGNKIGNGNLLMSLYFQ